MSFEPSLLQTSSTLSTFRESIRSEQLLKDQSAMLALSPAQLATQLPLLPALHTQSLPTASFLPVLTAPNAVNLPVGSSCSCCEPVGELHILHFDDCPLTTTAAALGSLLSVIGPVHYCEVAQEVVQREFGPPIGRQAHGYAVFADHSTACQAKARLEEVSSLLSTCSGTTTTFRVNFCRPMDLVESCTLGLKAMVLQSWERAVALAARPEIKPKQSSKVNALFVSRLHQQVTNNKLRVVFGKFGKLLACEVQYHSDGRSAGHGVIIFETIEAAEAALVALRGARVEGRHIEVTQLRMKKLPSKMEHLKGLIKRVPSLSPGSSPSPSIPGSPVSSPTAAKAQESVLPITGRPATELPVGLDLSFL